MDFEIPRLGRDIHPAYANPRPEVTALIPTWAARVLDVGCSVGVMGEALRQRGHHVTGIEYRSELAQAARSRLDRLIEADVEELARVDADIDGPFECVCFADVLEHLRDPWRVMRWADRLLVRGGIVIASLPNIARLETFIKVAINRTWPYEDIGVFDRTHLRFFARGNLDGLFDGTSLRISRMERVFRLTSHGTSWIDRYARYFGDLATFQFILRADRQW